MVLHKNLVTTNLHVPKDHTHVEADITDLQSYLTLAAGDLRYEPIGGAGGAYLPLAGGIMTGDIVFAFGEYLVGTTSGAVTKAICGVNALDECFIGHTDIVLDLVGSASRPTYNTSNQVALLSDIEDEPLLLHYSKGTGDFHAVGAYGISISLNGGAAVVTAYDMLKSLKGGAASPTYTYFLSKSSGVYGAGNSDPTAESVSFGAGDIGTNPVYMKVSDGTTTTVEITMFVAVQ